MFNLFKCLAIFFYDCTKWAYKKSLKAALKKIERNNKVIYTLNHKIIKLENDNDILREYLHTEATQTVAPD